MPYLPLKLLEDTVFANKRVFYWQIWYLPINLGGRCPYFPHLFLKICMVSIISFCMIPSISILSNQVPQQQHRPIFDSSNNFNLRLLLHEARNCASKGITFRCKFLWLTISFSAICKLCIVFYRAGRKARSIQNLSNIFKAHKFKIKSFF